MRGRPALRRNEGGVGQGSVGFQVEPGLVVPGLPTGCRIIRDHTSLYPLGPHMSCPYLIPVPHRCPNNPLHPPLPPLCLPCPWDPTQEIFSALLLTGALHSHAQVPTFTPLLPHITFHSLPSSGNLLHKNTTQIPLWSQGQVGEHVRSCSLACVIS